MSLIAWWPLNGHTKNMGLTAGTIQGTASNVVYTNGKLGSSMYTGSLYLSGEQWESLIGNTRSIAMWIYTRDDGSYSAGTPFFGMGGMTAPNNRKFTMFHYPAKTTLHCSWQHDDSGSTYWGCTYANFFPLNTWVHLCIVQDAGAGTITVYRNGEQYSKTTVSGLATMNFKEAGGANIRNSIDYQHTNDIRIYDHALSVKEVKNLSKALVMHYDFEDASINANLYNTISAIGSNVHSNCTVTAYGTNGFTMTSKGGDPYFGTSTTSGGSVGNNYKNTIPSGATQVCLSWTQVSGLELNKSYMTFLNSSGGAINTSHNNFGNQIVSVGTRRYVIQTLPSGTTSVHVRFGNQTLANGNSITIDQISLKVGNVYDFSQYDLQGSPYNNTGLYQATTITNVTTSQSAGKGRLSGAFNGSVLRCPFSTEGWTEFTMAAWVNPSARHSERSCVIIGGMYLTVDVNGKISVYCYGKSPAGYHASNGVVPLNTWTHIAAVWSSANVKLFINGVLDKTITTTGTASSSSHAKKDIGAENGNTSRIFQGLIDDVRVYGTALSDEDIRELALTRWAANKPGQVFSGLVNEGESKFQITSSGTNNCNTLNETGFLPTGYTPLDGVKMERVPWINTGVIFNDASIPIYISADVTPTATSGNNCLAGCGNSNWSGPVMFNFCSGKLEFGTGGYSTSTETHGAFAANERMVVGCVVKSSEQWWYKNGERIVNITSRTQPTTTAPLYIGTFKTPSGSVGSTNSFRGWIHGFEIKYGDIHKRFIPCKNGSVIGMYDVINHVFYSPIDGTYTAGKTIVSQDSDGSLHCTEFNEI